jgi:hypothetical protein
MSDQSPNDNDTPQEETTTTQSQTQTSTSNPLKTVVDTIGNVWSKGSNSGLTVTDSASQPMFTLPVNMIVLLLLALLIDFVPAVVILIVVALVAQFVYKASFSFGNLDKDAS